MHVLSLALLFAQVGMVVHASKHLKADPHAAPTTSQLCGECLSFAAMQNIVGGTPSVVPRASVAHDRALASGVVSIAPSVAFSAFRSRAPPFSS